MKLNIFSKWKPLGVIAARQLEYLTQKAGSNSIITVVRDKKTGNIVTKGYGASEQNSQQAAYNNLKRAGVDAIINAIETNTPISTQIAPSVNQEKKPEKKIDWRDGTGHSYKAQKKIVGESFEALMQLDPEFQKIIQG